jgi:hypothetical protein
MRKSKRWLTTFCSVLLAAGLFCAQVCQVVCATAACASQAQAAPAEPPPAHAHCHHSDQPATKTPPDSLPSAPKPAHDCQHTVLQSLPPDNQLAKADSQPNWQIDSDAPSSIIAFAHAPAAIHPLPRSLFRPPPRSWLTTVQRI